MLSFKVGAPFGEGGDCQDDTSRLEDCLEIVTFQCGGLSSRAAPLPRAERAVTILEDSCVVLDVAVSGETDSRPRAVGSSLPFALSLW